MVLLWKGNLPMIRSVVRLLGRPCVGRSVCLSVDISCRTTLLCSYRSTFFCWEHSFIIIPLYFPAILLFYRVSPKRRPFFKIEKYFSSTHSDERKDGLKIFKQLGVFFGKLCTTVTEEFQKKVNKFKSNSMNNVISRKLKNIGIKDDISYIISRACSWIFREKYCAILKHWNKTLLCKSQK